MTPRTPLRPAERAVVALDLLLGVALTGVAVFLLAVLLINWMEAPNPHDDAFGLLWLLVIWAALLGPAGVLFLVAALGVARRWRGRWWLHLLPPLAPALFIALADSGVLG